MRICRLMTSFLSLLLVFASGPALTQPAPSLPALGADKARVSVSGLSSGGFMAIQYEVAHSADIMGVGVVAGGGYNCAGLLSLGNPLMALQAATDCMNGKSDGAASAFAANQFAASLGIDQVSNIANHRIYLFSGTNDQKVLPAAMDHVRDFYTSMQVPDANVTYVNTIPAGHAFISAHTGGPCPANAAPFVNQCPAADGTPYDQAGEILSRIYGPLNPRAPSPALKPVPFDQAEFPWTIATGMAAIGYVYIPAQCQGRTMKCAVHVVFHGCLQSADTLDHQSAQWRDDVYGQLGYNEWADTNGIIILYPQVNAGLGNPLGCWDWWGYAGPFYQRKIGPQIMAIEAMINRLTS